MKRRTDLPLEMGMKYENSHRAVNPKEDTKKQREMNDI